MLVYVHVPVSIFISAQCCGVLELTFPFNQRGGQGNVHLDEETRKEKEEKKRQHHQQHPEGLADKLKHKLFGGGK